MITAAKNPTQIEAVAAKGPCLDEKNVPTSPGSAEPVKIPVMFYVERTVSFLFSSPMCADHETHVNKTQIDVNTMEHRAKRGHKYGHSCNTPMAGA